VIEASVPDAMDRWDRDSLVLLLRSVAFIPGIRANRQGFGRVLFGACLQAPLEALPAVGLASSLRSAWVLGHLDSAFWAPAIRDVRKSIDMAGRQTGRDQVWAVDDLACVARIAARVLAAAASKAPKGALDVPAVAASLAAAGKAPAYLICAPAAHALLKSAADAAASRLEELSPREVGIFAIALAQANIDDGPLFGLLAHRALQMLQEEARGEKLHFNGKDVAQLFTALASFGYHDEALLNELAARAENDFEEYDAKAKDIVLWAIYELDVGYLCQGQLSLAFAEYEQQLRSRNGGGHAAWGDHDFLAEEISPVAEYTAFDSGRDASEPQRRQA